MSQPEDRNRRQAPNAAAEPTHGLSSQQVIDVFTELLRTFPNDRWDLSPKQRMDLATSAQTASSQLQAIASVLLAEADKHDAFRRVTGSPTAIYMASKTNLSARQTSGMLWDAQRLDSHPVVKDAALTGQISLPHAKAVNRAMEQMPSTFTAEQTRQAETLLVDLAGFRTPDDVVKEAARVARQVDPQDADEREKTRLAREREMAWQARSLSFNREAGSIMFHGSLPQVEGEAFRTLIDAWAQQARRDSIDSGDTTGQEVTALQRRADALVCLVGAAQTGSKAPTLAGDRPVVTITLDYHKLMTAAFDAGVLPDGTPLTAGDLRRLCCDANLIPAVLGAASEPLDIGRANRFVTPALRKALTLRDKHCAHPNCGRPAHLCDAHHIVPWWHGGPTNLNNLVLLCPYHHGLVEPDKYGGRDQWTVKIHDGHPIFKPPRPSEGRTLNQTVLGDDTGPPGPG